MTELLALRSLTKRFGAFEAVRGVSLDVRAGEFLSLLGPSGSGKTTILNLIAGFEYPTTGAISLSGRDISFAHPSQRNIGMVFQRYALFPHMTVTDNVAYPLKVRGQDKTARRQRALAALEKVQLSDKANDYPASLSGGQQQRVALARAFVFDPVLLLMDEPLSALDKSLRQKLQLELKSLQRRIGATVVFVTHDQEEAITMSDRIAVINKGSLEQIGTPQDLFHRPATEFVAGFLGETNKLAAKVSGGVVTVQDAVVPCGSVMGDGARAVVYVRPERVAITPRAAGGAGGLPATVVEVIFAGSQTLCVARIGGDQTISARVDTRDLPDIRVGSEAQVSWEARDAIAFAQ